MNNSRTWLLVVLASGTWPLTAAGLAIVGGIAMVLRERTTPT